MPSQRPPPGRSFISTRRGRWHQGKGGGAPQGIAYDPLLVVSSPGGRAMTPDGWGPDPLGFTLRNSSSSGIERMLEGIRSSSCAGLRKVGKPANSAAGFCAASGLGSFTVTACGTVHEARAPQASISQIGRVGQVIDWGKQIPDAADPQSRKS